jgi:alpha-beta hydrolase superfamily lysophospholipase
MPFFDATNARIYYRAWEVEHPVAGLLFLHGGGEHSGQFSRLAARLNAADINVWAPDHQGHGISGGERGVIESVQTLADDAEKLTAIIRAAHPDLPLVIGGHSLGGWTTALVIAVRPEPYAGAFLTGASLRGRTALSATPVAEFQFDTSVLAADPSYLEELEKDPLVQLVLPRRDLSAAALAAAEEALRDTFPKVALPVLIINGTNDALASIEDARHWRDTLTDVRLIEIDGGLHNILNDIDYLQITGAVRDFILGLTPVKA